MSVPSVAPAQPVWRSPYLVIAAGCVIALLAFGPRSSMGFFLQPMSQANGWGRDVFGCPYCHGYEVRDQNLVVFGEEMKVKLVRQWSADVTHVPTVDAIEVEDDRLVAVISGSERIPADALVYSAPMKPRDEFLLALGAETVETPVGPFVRTDEKGRTSVPGVYAAGNVTDPAAIVIVAAAQGAQAAGMINVDLLTAAD